MYVELFETYWLASEWQSVSYTDRGFNTLWKPLEQGIITWCLKHIAQPTEEVILLKNINAIFFYYTLQGIPFTAFF